MKTHKRLITSSRGIIPTLRRELKYLRYKPFGQYSTGLYIEAPREKVAHLNLRLRTASKVWLILAEQERTTTFEQLFQLIKCIDWKEYIPQGTPLSVTALTHQSDLSSSRTIQSISHKAIITSLTGDDTAKRDIDNMRDPIQVRVTIGHNDVSIAINTSGPALHQRGRREDAGDAPLKEHIAAALVLMTSRSYESPLIDPYCGSGTILIEAALIASNRAPGMQRYFAFEQFPGIDGNRLLEQEKDQAKSRVYEKPYTLKGYDNDNAILETARNNARHAGVDQYITFEHANSTRLSFSDDQTVITNPPYGNRMGTDTADSIHYSLLEQASKTKNMTIISGYEGRGELLQEFGTQWKHVECHNGAEECSILLRK